MKRGIEERPVARIFLSHAEEMRRQYYGEKALAELRAAGEVALNETGTPLSTEQLIERAQGCQVIVSDRMTAGPAEVFEQLPDLVAFVRCAVDIRNVDVGAASHAGVLVTRASPGFVDSVAELAWSTSRAASRTRRSPIAPVRGPRCAWAGSCAAAPSASSASATSAPGSRCSASRSACG